MACTTLAVKRSFSAAFSKRLYSAPAERSIPPAKQKYVPTSGTYPKGFLAGSAFAGVKASNTKYDDVTLIASDRPCNASAVFTRNAFRAAPVQISTGILSVDRERAKSYTRASAAISALQARGAAVPPQLEEARRRYADVYHFYVPLPGGGGRIVQLGSTDRPYDLGKSGNWELVMGKGWGWILPWNALRRGMSKDQLMRWPLAPDALHALKDTARGTLHVVQLEVTDRESVKSCATEVADIVGERGIDYLVNNAGVVRSPASPLIVLGC